MDIKDQLEHHKEQETEKIMNTILDKYSFIFDKSVSHEDKIQKFIQVRYNKTIPIDVIKDELDIL